MERSRRFTEEQIIGVVREQEAGRRRRTCAGSSGISPASFTSKAEVRRPGGVRGASAADAGRRTCGEEAAGGRDAGERDAARRCGKRGDARRTARGRCSPARHHGASERRACSRLGRTGRRSATAIGAPAMMRLVPVASAGRGRRRFGYRRLGLLLARRGRSDEPARSCADCIHPASTAVCCRRCAGARLSTLVMVLEQLL